MFDTVELGKHAFIEMGQSPDSNYVSDNLEVGIPFLQGNAEFSAVYPKPKYSCTRPMKVCKKGDLLISVRAPVGEVNIADQDYCIGRGLAAIRFDKIPPTIGKSLIEHTRGQLQKVAQGSTFEAINKQNLVELKIANLPLEELPALEDIASNLAVQIRDTEAVIAKLQQLKQGLLHDLLTRGVAEDGELRPSYQEAPELYKLSNSVLGFIPKEWDLVSLADIASVNRGQFTHRPRNDPRFYGGEYPFIQTGDITSAQGGVLMSFTQTLSEKGTQVSLEYPAGTVAITIAANIADTAILGIPMYFPDSIVGAVPTEDIPSRFIELSIRRMKKYLDSRAPQSAQKNINLQDLRPLPIALPKSLSETKKISCIYDDFTTKLSAEKLALQKLKKKKLGLMSDLFTGKVRVTDLIKQAKAS